MRPPGKKAAVLCLLLIGITGLISFTHDREFDDRLRRWYSRAPASWPAPSVDKSVHWKELGLVPPTPVSLTADSTKALVELGKALFFDTRLSGSGTISCATCHLPERNWTDGKERSVGHNGSVNKRNAPTIENAWYFQQLFWDGRAHNLQDQAFAPINSETEMHSEMPELMGRLNSIRGYQLLFKKAFGQERIDADELTTAIATFEKTITTGFSRFDQFLAGDKKALSDAELRGLHLFRTKARCMNCHYGPFFSDNLFHNNGFQSADSNEYDKGRFAVTHIPEDIGRFKTPSLRDVARTGPWMHKGFMHSLAEIVNRYNTAETKDMDPLIKPLGLTEDEKKDLLAFLSAISAPPVPFTKPRLPL